MKKPFRFQQGDLVVSSTSGKQGKVVDYNRSLNAIVVKFKSQKKEALFSPETLLLRIVRGSPSRLPVKQNKRRRRSNETVHGNNA